MNEDFISIRRNWKANEDYIFTQRGFSFQTGKDLMEKAIKELGDDLPTAFCSIYPLRWLFTDFKLQRN